MNNVSKLAIVSFGLIALGLSTVITVSESSPNNGDDDSTISYNSEHFLW